MKQHFSAAAVVRRIATYGLLALAAWVLTPSLSACSSKPATPAAPTCDPTQCATGNSCISDGTETKCRLGCALNGDGTGGQQTCPFNYHCVDGTTPYCAADAVAYQKNGKGLWGAPCSPTGGLDTNPACDTDQNFWCYATSPFDGAAFCTQYGCSSDANCRGGYWCATINTAPNAVQRDRTVGDTRTACMPRTYCSPCKTDIDCPPTKGVRQHCVPDNAGSKFCSPECGQDSQCNQEAKCVESEEAGGKVCVPNAGACVGDGGFCSPCRSDADCKNGGACVGSSYSTETFCAVPSGVPCGVSGGCKFTSECPAAPVPGGATSCTFPGKADLCPDNGGAPNQWPSIPDNFCYGSVSFGPKGQEAHVPGCYTARR